MEMFQNRITEAMFKLALEMDLEDEIKEIEAIAAVSERIPDKDFKDKVFKQFSGGERKIRMSVFKRILVAVIILVSIFAMIMLCNGQFRDKVSGVVEKWHSDRVSYVTPKVLSAANFVEKDFEVEYIPENFELTDIKYFPISTVLLYTYPEEYKVIEKIGFENLSNYFTFNYGNADDFSETFFTENQKVYKRLDNGIEYFIHETTNSSNTHEIFFVNDGYYFIFQAPYEMEIETLFEIAKSIIPVPLREREPIVSQEFENINYEQIEDKNFEFGYLPEGIKVYEAKYFEDEAETVKLKYVNENSVPVIILMYNKTNNLSFKNYLEQYKNGIEMKEINDVCYFFGDTPIIEESKYKLIAWSNNFYDFMLSYDENISFNEIVKVVESLKETHNFY
ncbi:MAG: DUF4367 domain-containing protein [Oscillospiraceae bacterium]|jgi:hypothetical protein|nr:DUF4367 domain-containing protein [Oscillospiraceae bacterium]